MSDPSPPEPRLTGDPLAAIPQDALPTAEQPLRRAEFDDLFADDVLSVTQLSSLELRLELRPHAEVAARAASLAAKETGCCSFFTFALTITEGMVAMTVATEPDHQVVLAAFGSGFTWASAIIKW